MWLSASGEVVLLWLNVWLIAMFWRAHINLQSNRDYTELSGFQNCRWGLRRYLLNPNPVVQYFACRLQAHAAHVNLSVKCICQQGSAATGPPLRKSYSHLTHDVNLFRENQYCPDRSRWRCEVFPRLGPGFQRHMAASPDERLFPYVVKTAAQWRQQEEPPTRIGIQLGSKVRALPANQRRGTVSICKVPLFILSRWSPYINYVPLSVLMKMDWIKGRGVSHLLCLSSIFI